MYKLLRKKFAESINTVDVPEQFEWSKWIREPVSESRNIDRIYSYLSDDQPVLSFTIPEINSFPFKTKKARQYKSKSKFSIIKVKTSKVFFKLNKSSARKINIFNADTGKIIFSSSLNDGKWAKSKLLKPKKEYFIEVSPALFSFDCQSPEPAITDISVKSLDTETINIQAEISKPSVYDRFIGIQQDMVNGELFMEGFLQGDMASLEIFIDGFFPQITVNPDSFMDVFLPQAMVNPEPYIEGFISKDNLIENLFHIDFIHVDEIPVVNSFEISNVNSLIEKLDKDTSIKNIIPIPIQYLTNNEEIHEVEMDNINTPETRHFMMENMQPVEGVSISNYDLGLNNPDIPEKLSGGILERSLFENFDNLLKNEGLFFDKNIERGDNLKNIRVDALFVSNEVNFKDEDDPFQKIISRLLNPETNESEKIEVMSDFLYEFQKEGAEFLVNNKIALLNAELGLGKTYQTIAALKTLLHLRKIDKILLLCKSGDIGNLNFTDGWSGKLTELSKEIDFTIVDGNDNERKAAWRENKKLFIAGYETFFNDFNNELISRKIIDNFNCFIFDEAHHLLIHKTSFSRLMDLQNSNKIYTWYLSSRISTKIREELNYHENISIIEQRRNKIEIYEELPKVIEQDIWLELDDEQKTEYDNFLTLGHEKITKLLQNGNPFIIQSNVFTLLHQLKQVCNFSSLKNESSKTDYLLKQVETFVLNGKKAIVFSQYDKMGTQKIEKVLELAKIKYILLHSAMSLHELESAKKRFSEDKNIHVLLNGIKSRTGINFPEVQYIIHFDQWWNPATIWKMVENVKRSPDENINVYNYLAKDTIEENIKELLLNKGLLRKEIVEFLSAETINSMISSDEWMEILGIKASNSASNEKKKNTNFTFEKRIESLSIDELGKKTEMLFSRLGYKNLFLNKGNYEGEINIIGTLLENNNKIKVVAKCLFSDQIDIENILEYIEALQNDRNLGKNFIIHFDGLEEKLPSNVQKKIILINKELFTNYLINFRLI